MTFGQLADLRGLNGELGVKRLTLASLEGDVGGPGGDAGGSSGHTAALWARWAAIARRGELCRRV